MDATLKIPRGTRLPMLRLAFVPLRQLLQLAGFLDPLSSILYGTCATLTNKENII